MADDVIDIDLSNYRDRFGSNIPDGTYDVVIEDVEQGQSRAGNPMVTLHYRVVGGESDGANLLDRLTLSEGALWRAVSFLNAVGIETPRKRLQIPAQALRGKRLRVEVELGDEYNGRRRSEVRGHLPAGTATSTEAATDLADLPTAESTPTPAAEPETVSLDSIDL